MKNVKQLDPPSPTAKTNLPADTWCFIDNQKQDGHLFYFITLAHGPNMSHKVILPRKEIIKVY